MATRTRGRRKTRDLQLSDARLKCHWRKRGLGRPLKAIRALPTTTPWDSKMLAVLCEPRSPRSVTCRFRADQDRRPDFTDESHFRCPSRVLKLFEIELEIESLNITCMYFFFFKLDLYRSPSRNAKIKQRSLRQHRNNRVHSLKS